jgi:dCTP diphosphatase
MSSLPKKTNKTDATTTIQELKDAYVSFRNERGWKKYNTPRNLAISIAIEAAELMEHFQWGTEDVDQHKDEIASELADVVNYCIQFAEATDIDLGTAFYTKLEAIKRKYPTSLFNPETENLDTYHKIKQAYRTDKTKEES